MTRADASVLGRTDLCGSVGAGVGGEGLGRVGKRGAHEWQPLPSANAHAEPSRSHVFVTEHSPSRCALPATLPVPPRPLPLQYTLRASGVVQNNQKQGAANSLSFTTGADLTITLTKAEASTLFLSAICCAARLAA